MRPQHDFAPARAAAQHCSELLIPLRHGPDKGDAARQFIGVMNDALPERLKPLLGKAIRVLASEPSTQTGASLVREIERSALSYTARMSQGGLTLLVIFDVATVHSVTDRLFGGDGRDSDRTANSLPLSARLAMERIVRALASATSEQGEVVVQHEAALSRVALFPRGEYCISWTIEMAQNGFDSWKVQLAMLETALHEHAAHCGRANHGDDARGYPADAASAPFDAVPIPINAVLAEARLPLARIASLRPGDLIPLPLQREVPLRIGRDTIAHGSVGTLDDRVALQLTRIA